MFESEVHSKARKLKDKDMSQRSIDFCKVASFSQGELQSDSQ